MKSQIFNLFKECFFSIPITEDIFYSLFDYKNCNIITKHEDNILIGFSAVRDNNILLLCVAPKYQHRGYGRHLLLESEELIKRKGYNTIVLGDTSSKFFLGAPTTEKEWQEKHNYFFEKFGYTANNGCLEMVMQLKNYNLEHLNIELYPKNISFEYWTKKDKTELLKAVKEVEEDWVTYFEYDLPIYVAMEHGTCVGFTILSFDDTTLCSNGYNKVGMFGCVGVIPSKRSCGIGLAMVAHGTNELRKNGCDESYIHYTYLDKWYSKLGYQPILWYWFGKKRLDD
ncbi:GNAT family N-acetyltransferase [Mobilitalea sibirica]|uniref:GNAT family N-acetyltransferase n=1 Tax=Mobilitalea sibirica TaxID=1462919 RepID=A0A8J7HE21_9FIRM|nr:GNAT family N-acetyltransferase [Mobilitalea sibirica]MBH1941509.1 GNAT family N-acetyltransferase [Mobilitalea sibirica]